MNKKVQTSREKHLIDFYFLCLKLLIWRPSEVFVSFCAPLCYSFRGFESISEIWSARIRLGDVVREEDIIKNCKIASSMTNNFLLILVLPVHSFMSKREYPCLIIRFPGPILPPCKRCEGTEYAPMFRFHNTEGLWLVFTHSMKVIGLKTVSAPLKDE